MLEFKTNIAIGKKPDRKEYTVYLDVDMQDDSLGKCSFCGKKRKLFVEVITITQIECDYQIIDSEEIKKKVKRKLSRVLNVKSRRFCKDISCMTKNQNIFFELLKKMEEE